MTASTRLSSGSRLNSNATCGDCHQTSCCCGMSDQCKLLTVSLQHYQTELNIIVDKILSTQDTKDMVSLQKDQILQDLIAMREELKDIDMKISGTESELKAKMEVYALWKKCCEQMLTKIGFAIVALNSMKESLEASLAEAMADLAACQANCDALQIVFDTLVDAWGFDPQDMDGAGDEALKAELMAKIQLVKDKREDMSGITSDLTGGLVAIEEAAEEVLLNALTARDVAYEAWQKQIAVNQLIDNVITNVEGVTVLNNDAGFGTFLDAHFNIAEIDGVPQVTTYKQGDFASELLAFEGGELWTHLDNDPDDPHHHHHDSEEALDLIKHWLNHQGYTHSQVEDQLHYESDIEAWLVTIENFRIIGDLETAWELAKNVYLVAHAAHDLAQSDRNTAETELEALVDDLRNWASGETFGGNAGASEVWLAYIDLLLCQQLKDMLEDKKLFLEALLGEINYALAGMGAAETTCCDHDCVCDCDEVDKKTVDPSSIRVAHAIEDGGTAGFFSQMAQAIVSANADAQIEVDYWAREKDNYYVLGIGRNDYVEGEQDSGNTGYANVAVGVLANFAAKKQNCMKLWYRLLDVEYKAWNNTRVPGASGPEPLVMGDPISAVNSGAELSGYDERDIDRSISGLKIVYFNKPSDDQETVKMKMEEHFSNETSSTDVYTVVRSLAAVDCQGFLMRKELVIRIDEYVVPGDASSGAASVSNFSPASLQMAGRYGFECRRAGAQLLQNIALLHHAEQHAPDVERNLTAAEEAEFAKFTADDDGDRSIKEIYCIDKSSTLRRSVDGDGSLLSAVSGGSIGFAPRLMTADIALADGTDMSYHYRGSHDEFPWEAERNALAGASLGKIHEASVFAQWDCEEKELLATLRLLSVQKEAQQQLIGYAGNRVGAMDALICNGWDGHCGIPTNDSLQVQLMKLKQTRQTMQQQVRLIMLSLANDCVPVQGDAHGLTVSSALAGTVGAAMTGFTAAGAAMTGAEESEAQANAAVQDALSLLG